MSRTTKRIVSANDLLDGDVVYLTPGGSWSRSLQDAAVADDDLAANALLDIANRQPEAVVGPYLVSISQSSGSVLPGLVREQLRNDGPSVFAGSL